MTISPEPVGPDGSSPSRARASSHVRPTVADIEVQIAGPALVLFYAALQAENDPPSIASPDGTFRLSIQTCPPSFADAFRLWQQSVSKIQSYEPELRRDLALILCDQPPQSTPLRMDVVKTAADVKGIALEIL